MGAASAGNRVDGTGGLHAIARATWAAARGAPAASRALISPASPGPLAPCAALAAAAGDSVPATLARAAALVRAGDFYSTGALTGGARL